MNEATLWFNKTLSSVFNLLEILRQAQRPGERFRLICTHTRPAFLGRQAADAFEVEPRGLSEKDYVAWCAEFARRQRVDVFFPGRFASAVAERREMLEAVGCRVSVAADAATLRVLASKVKTYDAAQGCGVTIPEHFVVRTLGQFEAAYAELRRRGAQPCFKPVQGMYGAGFRIIDESGDPLKRLLSGDVTHIGLVETRRLFADRESFTEMLVMRRLAGVERSVDCLGQDGRLVRCVVRRKSPELDGGQWIESNPALEVQVARLTERFKLTGMFNVQFRDHEDTPHLLEINPRPSGGVFLACRSGVALPYWAARLALGTARPEDVPAPRVGFAVREAVRAVELRL
jgi:carbamoylphosphate synthase large subunit